MNENGSNQCCCRPRLPKHAVNDRGGACDVCTRARWCHSAYRIINLWSPIIKRNRSAEDKYSGLITEVAEALPSARDAKPEFSSSLQYTLMCTAITHYTAPWRASFFHAFFGGTLKSTAFSLWTTRRDKEPHIVSPLLKRLCKPHHR